jgi:hypothetical protein
MCATHQVPLADGAHNECPIELLACPEHHDKQLRDMGELDSSDLPESQVDAESTMFRDDDGNPIVGFCLWCNKDFYSMEEAKAHNADDSKACPMLQEQKILKRDSCYLASLK